MGHLVKWVAYERYRALKYLLLKFVLSDTKKRGNTCLWTSSNRLHLVTLSHETVLAIDTHIVTRSSQSRNLLQLYESRDAAVQHLNVYINMIATNTHAHRPTGNVTVVLMPSSYLSFSQQQNKSLVCFLCVVRSWNYIDIRIRVH